MKQCTKCGCVKPLDRFTSDRSKPDGKHLNCKDCRAVAKRAYYQANKERQKRWHAEWLVNNREAKRRHARNYVRRNLGRVLANTRAYQLSKRKATASWANKDAISEIYEAAAAWNEMWPDDLVHVDHIIPIQGKYVCGLHVETNLRIVRATDNLAKNNRYDPS